MATGSGKTFTAITSIYRLMKPPVRMRRVLFLVDTKNSGRTGRAGVPELYAQRRQAQVH
ncbi:MAG: DEAD/DEAH box helicase family protein [Flavobacteriales bacterium]|nr:DEAD/DEAH box helicase family protein [Flavobacteriales bacterium]